MIDEAQGLVYNVFCDLRREERGDGQRREACCGKIMRGQVRVKRYNRRRHDHTR